MSFLKRPLSRKEDFLVALFLAIVFTSYLFSKPCALLVSTILWGALVLVIVVFIWITLRTQLRCRHVVAILAEGDPERFLCEIEKDISWARFSFKRLLLVNKSAGLVHAGRAEDAAELLGTIDPRKLRGIFKPLYYNNFLAALVTIGDPERVRVFFEANRAILEKKHKNPALYWALKGTVASYKLRFEKKIETENTFRGILEADVSKIARCRSYYWLSYLEQLKGNSEAARDYYRSAQALCPNVVLEPLL